MPSSDPPTAAEMPQPELLAPTTANSKSQNQSQGNNGTQKGAKAQDAAAPTDASKKPTNAELKAIAKAEKAARRAQAAQDKQGGGAAPSPVAQAGPVPKAQGQAGGKQHKRTASMGMGADARGLPLRAQKAAVPVPEVPKKEDKTVEFFRHLYRSRTTTIAGASKEVHPAVLALGLQMSNYTICGSCARLVATLQAFKRVSTSTTNILGNSLTL